MGKFCEWPLQTSILGWEIFREKEAVQPVAGYFLETVKVNRTFFMVKLRGHLGHGPRVGWW